MGKKFRALFQRSPLLTWLVSLNLLALLGWGGYGIWHRAATQREEEKGRRESSVAFQKIGGLSEEDAGRFQAIGRKFKREGKGSDEDIESILRVLDGESPGSPERYTNPKQGAMAFLAIAQLAEIKTLTPTQEERIARRLLPLPPRSNDASTKTLYKMIAAYARRMKTEPARGILKSAVEDPN